MTSCLKSFPSPLGRRWRTGGCCRPKIPSAPPSKSSSLGRRPSAKPPQGNRGRSRSPFFRSQSRARDYDNEGRGSSAVIIAGQRLSRTPPAEARVAKTVECCLVPDKNRYIIYQQCFPPVVWLSSSWWPVSYIYGKPFVYLSTHGHGLPLPSKRPILLLRIFYSSIHKKLLFLFLKKIISLSKENDRTFQCGHCPYVALFRQWMTIAKCSSTKGCMKCMRSNIVTLPRSFSE